MSVARSLQDWRAAARVFEGPHGAVAWWTEGEGPPLLLLHGYPTSSWDWRKLWPALAQRRKVIALDLLGFGLSAKPRNGDYRIAAQADLVGTLCAQIDVTTVDVIAHDHGGLIAQELLARQGEDSAAVRIESVALISVGLDVDAYRASVRRLASALAGPFVSRGGFRRALAREFEPAFRPSAAELEEAWALARERRGHALGRRLVLGRAERRAQRDRWAGAVAARLAPERFIFGARTLAEGGALARSIRRRLPDADIVLMEGVGRYPHLEAPDAVLEAIESFHAGLRARTRVA